MIIQEEEDVSIIKFSEGHIKLYFNIINVLKESLDKIKEVFEILNLDYKDAITDNAQDIYMSMGYTQEDLNNLKFEGGK